MDKTNTAKGQMRLARTLAGLGAPQEPPPVTAASFNPFAALPPQAGMRNDLPPPGLPAFEQPGAMAANYMPHRGLPDPQMTPVTVSAAPPQPAAPQPQPAPMPAMGGQGFAGVEPPAGSIPPAYDPNLDPRFLPEQWRGAFTNWQS